MFNEDVDDHSALSCLFEAIAADGAARAFSAVGKSFGVSGSAIEEIVDPHYWQGEEPIVITGSEFEIQAKSNQKNLDELES
jgi:hypothetical protein